MVIKRNNAYNYEMKTRHFNIIKSNPPAKAGNITWTTAVTILLLIFADLFPTPNLMAQYPSPNLAGTPYTTGPKARTTSPLLVGQCTWYVRARIQEAGLISASTLSSKSLFLGDAKSWADEALAAGYSTGSQPKQGSIAVWTSGIGHVAFVESVVNGVAQFTECNATPSTANPNTVVVCRDDLDQGGWKIKLRDSASTSGNLLGYLPKYNVFSVVGGPASANGFTWFRLQGSGFDGWAALLEIDSGSAAVMDPDEKTFSWSFTRIKLAASPTSITISGNPNAYIYLDAQTSPPILTSPGNETYPGTAVATLAPTFSWQPGNGATEYGLYISKRNVDGTYALIFDSESRATITGSSFTLPAGVLINGQSYRWNMRAKNSAGWATIYASPFYFEVSTMQLPGPPTFTAPGDTTAPGPTLTTLTPIFTWNNTSGATGVGLYIRDLTDNVLIYPNAAGTTTAPLAGTSFPLPGGYLANGHSYRAAMTSFTGASESAQGGYRYFQSPAGNSVPAITSLSPMVVPASPVDQPLIINGSGFQPGATLTFDPPTGANIPSTASQLEVLSSSQITCQFNNGGGVGAWTVAVNNPDGHSSGAFQFTISPAAGDPTLAGKIIGLDPGHGGTNTGAVGPTGLFEKQVNLSTALAAKKYLEANGATVIMTRTTDTTLPLTPTPDPRTEAFKNNHVDWGISIHHNANGNSAIDNIMAFIYSDQLLATRGKMASNIIQRLATTTGLQLAANPASTDGTLVAGHTDWKTSIPGVGQANLHMLREPENGGIPAVLVEIAFLSNPTEEQKLRDPDYLDANGWAVYAGIADYYGITPKPRSATPPTPPAPTDPVDFTAAPGGVASFSITASGTQPISYQWYKNGVAIPGANSPSYATPPVSLADDGAQFRCEVANPVATVRSGIATLHVTSTAQVLTTISISPGTATVVTGGQQAFVVSFLDQNGKLMAAPSSFSWQVTGDGAIGSDGVYTGGKTPGTYFVTVVAGGRTGTAQVAVAAPNVVFSNPSPAAGAVNVARLQPSFSWTAPASIALEFAFKLGTNPNCDDVDMFGFGAVSGPVRITRNLLPDKTYYWKVLGRDNLGVITESPIWQFKTEMASPLAIAIVQPTTSPTLTTSEARITISGAATALAGLPIVNWTNDRGGTGSCEGTSAWTARNIPLFSGINVITINVIDAVSNAGSAKLTVTYAPPNPGSINPPSNLQAKLASSKSVEFNWQDNSDNETLLEIQIAYTINGAYGRVVALDPNTTHWVHNFMYPLQLPCFFRIRASNNSGESFSNIAEISGSNAILTWSNPSDIIYGTPLSVEQLNASANVPGAMSYAPPLGTVLNAGDAQSLSATFTPADTSMAPATKTVAINVLKKSLTVAANNASRAYGAQNPAFGATITGFIGGEDASVVSGSPSLVCAATASSPAGAYEIVPSQGTLNAGNYAFDHFANGTLTVWPAGALKLSAIYGQGLFQCTVNGPADARFILQASSDLEAWSPLATNTIPAGGSVTVSDPDSTSNQDRRFYRAIMAAESPLMPPVVIRQPDSQTAVAGSTVLFDLEVKGSPLAYQWQFNGVNIPGATNSTLQFGSVQLADAGNYAVVISNAAGSVTSQAAVLTVEAVPSGPFLWAKTEGGNGDDQANAMVADGNGNCYVAGQFEGSATLGNTTLSSQGQADVLLAKYNPQGLLLWAVSAGGTGYDLAASITMSPDGFIYVAGAFSKGAVFGANRIASPTTGSSVFVAKYSGQGECLWAKCVAYTDHSNGMGATSIKCDDVGNLFLAGSFWGNAAFGSATLSSQGLCDIFISKLDSNGSVLWAKSAGGNGYDSANALVADSLGNIFVTGYFGAYSSANGTFEGITLANAGAGDIFVAKYDPNGQVVWAKRAGGTALENPLGMAAIGAGDVVIAGAFSGTIVFGATSIASKGQDDIFLARLNSDGDMIWGKSLGGTGNDACNGVATDQAGNIYLAGNYQGNTMIGGANLTARGGYDVYVTQCDSSGNPISTCSAGGAMDDNASAIAVTPRGDCYIAGSISGQAVFGSIELSPNGKRDVFIANPIFPQINTLPPTIIRQPGSQMVPAGASAVFSAEATGSSLSYQWQLDGADIIGATNASYSIANAQVAHAGNYNVVVRNLAGTVASQAAVLKVVPATTAALVASALNNPSFLAIDGGNLYFADNTASDGIIKTVSQNGGSVATLYTGAVLPESGGYRCIGYLQAEGGTVYGHYGSYDNLKIFSGPESGGALTTLVSIRGGGLIGVIGNDLYFSMGFSSLNKMPKSGGASSQVASGYFIRGTAFDPEAIYFVDYSTKNVYKCSLASGVVAPLITGNTAESSLFLDAQYLYQNIGGSIRKVAKSGGQAETLFTGTAANGGYASDGTYVYFETNDAINYIPAGGGLPTKLISILPGSLTSLIVDKTSVYWTDISAGAGSGKIWRMPKP